MTVAVVVPYRDRGIDPLRSANVITTGQWWRDFGDELIFVSDDRFGDAQFNRSAAYNKGCALTEADVFVFAESDMLVPLQQVQEAVELAESAPGLVVPFTDYHYLSERDSRDVRVGYAQPQDCLPESIRGGGASIGAVNVLSRETLTTVGGWDEVFEGSWYDDTAMRIAFDVAAGPTRWVSGPGYHLYHLPGWTGSHLTNEDRAATEANKQRLHLYEQAETAQRIRELTGGSE